MAVKRSRMARSPSSGEVSLGQPPPTVPAPRDTTADTDRPRPAAILSLSPPVGVDVLSQGPAIGGFLEKCYYCKKALRAEDDVFMYGYLQAFCKPDCRNKQIAVDNSRARAKLSEARGKAGASIVR